MTVARTVRPAPSHTLSPSSDEGGGAREAISASWAPSCPLVWQRGTDVVGQHDPLCAGQVGEASELIVERRCVAGGGDAADDGDTEGSAKLSDGVVHG